MTMFSGSDHEGTWIITDTTWIKGRPFFQKAMAPVTTSSLAKTKKETSC